MASLTSKILSRLASPLGRLHYRLLFGRPGALAAWSDRLVRRLEAHSRRGDLPASAAAWNEQYSAGKWSYLRDPAELARYGVLVAFCERLTPCRRILDVGCGEGILRDLLRRGEDQRYLGIDVSNVAIEAARRRAGAGDEFRVDDAETFATDERFDAVVLNESLYYLHDPLGQAGRYLELAADGGVLIVSMFESTRTRAILRALERRLAHARSLRLEGERGAWLLAAFQPPPSGEAAARRDPPSEPRPR
jgi:2-polyprenyl-6-hydroxyphenyl methylase/3-demethylubiquinone-9 3-methyltransferase